MKVLFFNLKKLKILAVLMAVLTLSISTVESFAVTSLADDVVKGVIFLAKNIGKPKHLISQQHRLVLGKLATNIDDYLPHLKSYPKEIRIKLLIEAAEHKKLVKPTEALRLNHALLNNKVKEDELIMMIKENRTFEQISTLRKPLNADYAGKTYQIDIDKYPTLSTKYPKGVDFTNDGYPNFSPYSKNQVSINDLSGNYLKDAKKANQATGYKQTPEGYTWHHHQNCKTMLLVPSDLHNIVRHSGGVERLKGGGCTLD